MVRKLSALALLFAATTAACTAAPEKAGPDFAVTDKDAKEGDDEGEGGSENGLSRSAAGARSSAKAEPSDDAASDCKDACEEDETRCAPDDDARTEVCSIGLEGCRKWVAGPRCADGQKCDAAENGCPGATTSACVDAAGCSATTDGDTKCVVTGGKSRLRCEMKDGCWQWRATTACEPDETCGAGSCRVKTTACQNACTLGDGRCIAGAARSTQVCGMGTNGCTIWKSGPSCSPDSICVDGGCN